MILFRHASLFDGFNDELLENYDVLIEGDRIAEISDQRIQHSDAQVINLQGDVLMPGLIDAHVHVYASGLDLVSEMRRLWTYLSHYAARFMRHMLDSGFTSIRDVGGGDHGLATALAAGLVEGPRLFYGGRVLSQTGGHGDLTRPGEDIPGVSLCGCGARDQRIAVVADGKDQILATARRELQQGASHIKIMASGGVASPGDSLGALQYSDEEISCVVDECRRHRKYVAAHCHPADAIERCVRLGVRTIEHGTLITKSVAEQVAASDSYVVPTMATLFALHEDGPRIGLPAASIAKLGEVIGHVKSGLEIMRAAGVRIGFGTDLLGPQHPRNGTEFTLRSEIFSPLEILRQATSMNAEILQSAESLGCVRPGARADLIAVNGNPLKNIGLLSEGGRHLSAIVIRGRLYKNVAKGKP